MGGRAIVREVLGKADRHHAIRRSSTTHYVCDVNASLPNVLTDGTPKYIYSLGLTYAVDGPGNVQVYHTDGLGSVRMITNATGKVVATYQTDAFGVPTQTQGSMGITLAEAASSLGLLSGIGSPSFLLGTALGFGALCLVSDS